MTESVVGGDLVLAARPATAESWSPYGRLLWPGERASLKSKGVLLALDAREAAPRRVRHLQRYPEASRFVLSTGSGPLAVIVCGGGERPVGPAAAFHVPAGVGIVIAAGVWHAGPIPLAEANVLEALETHGATDRLDRASVAESLGAEGLRIVLPDEPGAPGPGLDLADAHSLRVAPEVAGRVKLACVALDRLAVRESGSALQEEAEHLAIELRRQFGGSAPPSEIAGLEPVRDVYRALGIDPTKTRPSSEALLRRVLQGKPLYRVNALVDAMNLCSLKTLVPFGVYDRAHVAGPVVLRLGREGEGYEGIGRGHVGVAGRPVLADREGPFGNPTADSLRTRVSASTTRALVVLYLPPTIDDAAAGRLLDEVTVTVRRHVGGEETARRLAP